MPEVDLGLQGRTAQAYVAADVGEHEFDEPANATTFQREIAIDADVATPDVGQNSRALQPNQALQPRVLEIQWNIVVDESAENANAGIRCGFCKDLSR